MDAYMTSRLLPPDEWPRLDGTELELVWPHLDPLTAHVVVVEDERGELVGCWAAYPLFHAEGVWMAPDHRGKAGVARMLLAGMQAAAAEAGYRSIVTASLDPKIDRLLEKLDALALPGRHFVFPVEQSEKVA